MKHLKRLGAVLAIAIALLLVSSSPALAVGFATADVAAAASLEIPTVPLAIVALVAFLSPYAIAVINQSWWPPRWKRSVAVLASLAITALALVIYYSATDEPLPQWWFLLLLGLAVSQASYTLVTKRLGAEQLEAASSVDR